MKMIQRKPTKTISGVTPVAVVIKPRPCEHGTCIYCPTLNVPQSYTPKSPAIMRAMMLEYNPYKQVISRIQAFKAMKHPTDKIELIIMGGTFLSYPIEYQYKFILDCYNALNQNSSSVKPGKEKNINYTHTDINNTYLNKTLKPLKKVNLNYQHTNNIHILKKQLEQAKKINEKATHRCIALCIETRPDVASDKEIKRMLEFGCTRVEIGVQMPSDIIYKKVKRGHNVQDVIKATKNLKDAGFKVSYHIMPGLPGSSIKNDVKLFKSLFENENFRPDQLKIYPCQVIKGAELENIYYKGKYKPYTREQLIDLIIKFKQLVPKYCRIMRIMREIPPEFLVAGTITIDLRKVIHEKMLKEQLNCNCIRCREIGFAIRDKKFEKIDKNLKLNIIKYKASKGTEFFLEIINEQDIIFGLARLRIPDKSDTLLVRELHVYGQAVELGKKVQGKTQHTGLGKWLMKEAEKIAKENKCKTISVISGVGVREYYKNLGYELDKDGIYMVKKI
jgi:elongator complex protein 3